jgi:hypothetical protein
MPMTIVYVWRRDEAESLADYLVSTYMYDIPENEKNSRA